MRPRANTLGILERNGQFLLERQCGKHSKGEGVFYRPIGGTIELGEYSAMTLVREFQEEIQKEIEIIRYLGCIENVYHIGEKIGHEITQLYEVTFKDRGDYERKKFQVTEGEKKTIAEWVPLETLLEEKIILYPTGLDELLKREFNFLPAKNGTRVKPSFVHLPDEAEW